MRPFVGSNYQLSENGRLLLIAESYYFPSNSTKHLEAEKWYELNESELSSEELSYINCRGLLESPWKPEGHAIYREVNRCLESTVPSSDDRGVSHVAFANTFYRPAVSSGGSFRHCCKPIDWEKAVSLGEAVIRALEPDLVVYVTKYGWDSVGRFVAAKVPEVSFDFTCHPADPRHWNVKSYAHGRPKFMKILQSIFSKNQTPRP